MKRWTFVTNPDPVATTSGSDIASRTAPFDFFCKARMCNCFLIIITFIGATGMAQEQHRKIGAIEFFGSSGMDLQRIRANLPTKEGDELPEPSDAMLATMEKISESIKQTTGIATTDVDIVCCDIRDSR